jgi:hypothetical protein
MTTLDAERLVDGGKDAIGCVRRPGDVRVGEDGQQLRRRATKDAWCVNVPHSAREGSRHRLEHLLRRPDTVCLDQQNSEVALVSVGSGELVLEHRPDEAIVEESGGAVHDVERFSLWVVGLDAARRAENRTVRQRRSTSQAGLGFGPAA